MIDDNGAGLGWSLNQERVADSQYDLLTVLAHELGHVLAREHSDEGVMSPVLSPGHRATEIDAFFATELDFGLIG